ncbi:MAG: MCP four helix bundle domain-containing protein, partial [Deltaproteobacteria bacterium]|nr:MCP four helix bundle domain-containing protein [Deltaproteobacteria bacterium]
MFKNVKIGAKLMGGFSLAVLIMVIVAAGGYWGAHSLAKKTEEIAANRLPSIIGLGLVSEAQIAIQRAERAILIPEFFKDEKERNHQIKNAEDAWKKVEKGWKIYEPLPQTKEEEKLWKQFVPVWEQWKDLHKQVFTLVKSGKRDEALALSTGKAREALNGSEKLLDELVTMNENLAAEEHKAATAMAASVKMLLLIVALIGVVLAILSAVFISRDISKILNALLAEIKTLVAAAVGGKLATRADPEKINFEFRGIATGLNETLDAVIGPLNVAAEYVDRISKGDIPPKITDSYNGDFNEIKNNLNQAIDAVNALVADANVLSKAAVEGKLATRADATKHQGDFRKIVEGVNQTLDAVIGPLNVAAEYVDRISKGDIPPKITDSYNGDFNEIKNNLNQCIDAVNVLVADANMLSKAAVEGKLATRADAAKHQGDFRKIVEGVNQTLDAVIGPLNVAAEYVDRISKGDLPPKITDAYNGDFNEIKNNLNNCIDNINALVGDAGLLVTAAVEGKLATRADATKHQGDFRKIVEGVNQTLDRVVGFIDDMPTPAMIIDNDYSIMYMNKIGAQVGNRQPKDLLGTKCFEHFRTSDCRTAKCACDRSMQSGSGATSETDAHPGTLNLDISYSATPVKNREGKVIGAFEVVTDQTAVKQAMRLADKVKTFQDNEVAILLTGLEAMAQGKMAFELADVAGDSDTAVVKQAFDRLKTAVSTCRDAVNAMTTDAGVLVKAAVEGKLATRADATKHQGDFRKIVEGVNQTLDAVIGPLNVAAEYVDRISKGETPPVITDNYNGDFNEIKNNLNACIEATAQQANAAQKVAEGDLSVQIHVRCEQDILAKSMNNVIGALKDLQKEMSRLTIASREGLLSERGKTENFKGAYAEVVTGVNEMLDAILLPIGEGNRILSLICGGNLREKIEIACKGDHERMKDAINGVHTWLSELVAYVTKIANGDLTATMSKASEQDQIHEWLVLMKNNINALVGDAGMLVTAAVEGKLATRADATKHQGDYRKIVEGVNQTLDAVIGPLNVAAEYVDRISKGDLPPKITDAYNGDFNEIKNNLNNCIDNINALVGDAGLLVTAAVEGKLATRADATKHQGDFQKIVKGVNQT